MNSSKEYFEKMRVLKAELMPEFSSILNRLKEKSPLLLTNSEFLMFYNKRIYSKSVLLRPYITKTFFSLDNSEHWQRHKLALALVEIVNISTYQSNIVLDSKDKLIGKNSNNFIISSIFSKLLVNDAIQHSEYSDSDKLFMYNTITECLEDLYYGQYLDTNILKFSNSELSKDLHKITTTYIERCRLLGGSLITMCANIAIHYNPNLTIIADELKSIAHYFGMAGQVLNDLGDLVAESRIYSTQKFSDIKNERLTLPIFIVNELIKCDYNKEALIKALNDKTIVSTLKQQISSQIQSYLVLIEEKLNIIKKKGYNICDLERIVNLLLKSRYIVESQTY